MLTLEFGPVGLPAAIRSGQNGRRLTERYR